MPVLVVDASVLVVALADDGPDGDVARARIAGKTLSAPQVVDLEVLSVLRRATARGRISARRAEAAVEDLLDMPIERADLGPLLFRCWELRANVTPYDAAYVALAEILDATFVTADARLGGAPGPRCRIAVLG